MASDDPACTEMLVHARQLYSCVRQPREQYGVSELDRAGLLIDEASIYTLVVCEVLGSRRLVEASPLPPLAHELSDGPRVRAYLCST